MRIGIVGAAAGGQEPYWLPGATQVGSAQNLDANSNITNGFDISSNGSYLYTMNALTNKVIQYTMSTPWDLSTVSYTRDSTITHTGAGYGFLQFHPSGTSYYVVFSSGVFPSNTISVFETTLSTPWDISTNSTLRSFDIRPQLLTLGGQNCWSFKSDGTEVYISQTVNSNSPWTYTLSTPWEASITSATYDAGQSGGNHRFGSVGQTTDWNPAGTQMFFTNLSSNLIQANNYSSAWDPSTFTGIDGDNVYDASSLSWQHIDSVRIKDSGKRMYLQGRDSGTVGCNVAQYTLAT